MPPPAASAGGAASGAAKGSGAGSSVDLSASVVVGTARGAGGHVVPLDDFFNARGSVRGGGRGGGGFAGVCFVGELLQRSFCSSCAAAATVAASSCFRYSAPRFHYPPPPLPPPAFRADISSSAVLSAITTVQSSLDDALDDSDDDGIGSQLLGTWPWGSVQYLGPLLHNCPCNCLLGRVVRSVHSSSPARVILWARTAIPGPASLPTQCATRDSYLSTYTHTFSPLFLPPPPAANANSQVGARLWASATAAAAPLPP
jgi:hypothetical protein